MAKHSHYQVHIRSVMINADKNTCYTYISEILKTIDIFLWFSVLNEYFFNNCVSTITVLYIIQLIPSYLIYWCLTPAFIFDQMYTFKQSLYMQADHYAIPPFTYLFKVGIWPVYINEGKHFRHIHHPKISTHVLF